MALDLAPFGRWTLRDKAAQRRSASHPALFRRAADYVDKILKGAKPPGWLGAKRHDSALAFDLGGAVASTDRVFFVVTVTQF